ncbi:MAG TPA: helix-turn-helix transcriptional regulator, partial [Chthoniobacterales bacterium]
DMEITPSHMEHRARTHAHAHIAVHFSPEELARHFGLYDPAQNLTFTPHLQDRDCRQILELLHRAVLNLQAVPPLYAEGLIAALSARVFGQRRADNAEQTFTGVATGRSADRERFQELQNWVDARLDQAIALEAMAAHVGMNPYQLVRAFRRWRQTSPYQFVLTRRLAVAKELLCSTDLSLGEIAYRTGFYDQSHLARHFKSSVGTNPRRYRLTHAAGSGHAWQPGTPTGTKSRGGPIGRRVLRPAPFRKGFSATATTSSL